MSSYDVQYIDPQSEFLENAWYVAAGRCRASARPERPCSGCPEPIRSIDQRHQWVICK